MAVPGQKCGYHEVSANGRALVETKRDLDYSSPPGGHFSSIKPKDIMEPHFTDEASSLNSSNMQGPLS